MSEAPRVTIAGGGMSGLTAALRLAQRGYQVTVCEQKDVLGGNLGSRPGPDGVELDIYPRMYLNWYDHFWRPLAERLNPTVHTGVLAGDPVPVLDAERLAAQPPLRFWTVSMPRRSPDSSRASSMISDMLCISSTAKASSTESEAGVVCTAR